ncbi:MAG: hypothetical protein U9N77_08885 [Thermodesulfobacteriota bacterium]|nr:hypothetical protein [Thermodesulfobacteriota bacterium]
MNTRKQALAIAKQFRTCPPLFIRDHPDLKTENENHLKICPFCAIDSPDGVQEWQELSESFRTQFMTYNEQGHILPGQIRQVRPELGCWRDDFYYNPPLVLVVNDIDEMDQAVQVAQVWHDLPLASPGDLIPPPELITGFKEIFIETWNMYTLQKSDLGICLGEVASQVVSEALKMKETPDYLPEMSRRPMPLAPEDPRRYFHQVEIETGYTFASMAADALMDNVVKSGAVALSLDHLVKSIKKYISAIDWYWVPDTVNECLAAIKFPTESFVLCAAEGDQKTIHAVYLQLKNAKFNKINPIECIIHHVETKVDSYTVSGDIPDLPDNLAQDAFQCHITNSEKKFLFQGRFFWDTEGKHFRAEFDKPLEQNETVSIIIINDTQGEIKT